MVGEIESYGAALDWVTLSARSGEVDSAKFRQFSRDMERTLLAGSEAVPMNVSAGGYAGIKTNGWQFKHRPRDGHRLIQVEGSGASEAVEFIEREKVPYKITRIDAQVTAKLREPNPWFGRQIIEEIRAGRTAENRQSELPCSTFANRLGDTGVCLGSRASDAYTRIYDFEAKHCPPTTHRVIRAEGEFKGIAAERFLAGYVSASDKKLYCAGVVQTRLKRHGISLEVEAGLPELKITGTKGSDDIERRLKYVKTSLIPFLAKLQAEGWGDEVLEMLRAAAIVPRGD